TGFSWPWMQNPILINKNKKLNFKQCMAISLECKYESMERIIRTRLAFCASPLHG
ncbi:MAG: hypothetical protein ACI8YC_000663, partial [Salibacteraceae bacterium]